MQNVHILFYAGMENQEHYFVATQDKALRVALGKLPGGASVFVNVNGVQMEQPSEVQRRAMKQVTAVFYHYYCYMFSSGQELGTPSNT